MDLPRSLAQRSGMSLEAALAVVLLLALPRATASKTASHGQRHVPDGAHSAWTSARYSYLGDALVCNPVSFGARGDDKTDNTEAIQRGIDTCAERARGGNRSFVLSFPPGIFLTGSIQLRSYMTLRLSKGTVLAANPDPALYPLVPPLPSYGVGRDADAHNLTKLYRPWIFGSNLTEVIIEGSGMDNSSDSLLDGRGHPWWDRFVKRSLQYSRPRVLQLMYSQDVIIRDLRIRDPPFWNVHMYASRNILIERLNITAPFHGAPNSDGVDLDSVLNATLRFSTFSTGDDAVAIKSGFNQAGVDFAHASAHIHIHDLRVYAKTIAIGSEMSGGVHDVLIENILFGDSRKENDWHGIFIKGARARGGVVQNVHWRNVSTIRHGSRERPPFIEITLHYSKIGPEPVPAAKHPPVFRNISFDNMFVDNTQQVAHILGLSDSPIADIRINGLHATNYNVGFTCKDAVGVVVTNSDVPMKGCHAGRHHLSSQPVDPLFT